MPVKGQHVVPKDGKWGVRQAGSVRTTGIYTTQKEAIIKATELAKKQKTELFIHGRDGRIRERNSYGTDPLLPKG